MKLTSTNLKVILLHGNGGGTSNDNWLPFVKRELEKKNISVVARDFPDNDMARETIWMPFLKDELDADENTILVGHSSGAVVAMRFAEQHRIFGSALVGAYHTDLGMEREKASGYFDRAWNWDQIRKNQNWIIQFASTDDKWIPIEQPRFIRNQLKTEYYEFANQGHFGGDYLKRTFPELVSALFAKVEKFNLNHQ